MKFWKRILLVSFSISLIFNLSLVVYLQTIQKTVLNPAFLQGELDELNFYPLVKENLLFRVSHGGYSNEKFQEILDKAITESWLKTQTNSLITSLLSYLNSETENLTLEVSVLEVKENLELPPLIVTTIPDKFDILQNLGEKDQLEFKKGMKELRTYISYLHLAFYWLVTLLIVSLLMIILLAKELKSIFRRIGLAFLISGSSLYFGNFLTMKIVSTQFPPEALPSFIPQDLLLKISRDFLEPITFWGIGFMALGGMLIVGGFLLKKKKSIKEVKMNHKLLIFGLLSLLILIFSGCVEIIEETTTTILLPTTTIATSTTTTTAPLPPALASCSDSDGGKNYYVKGTATFCFGGMNPVCAPREDACQKSGKLREYYCEDSKLQYIDYKCPGGCQNGACATLSCKGEGERVNRNPFMGPVDEICCSGLKEIRISKSYSICVNCGDGICNGPEYAGNCPEDCENSKEYCGVRHPCWPEKRGCYKFPDEEKPICWVGDPCEKCPSGKCIIAETYPMQVFCEED